MVVNFKNFEGKREKDMFIDQQNYLQLVSKLEEKNVSLVAISKTRTVSEIMQLYNYGHRDFGENYVQELTKKYEALPKDIRWHLVGHLQTNKVKYIASFIYLIHSVDSERLLHEIDKQGRKYGRKISCLLQIHIAKEATKFGLDYAEAESLLKRTALYPYAAVCGLMGMATHTDDTALLIQEFSRLKHFFDTVSIYFDPSYKPVLSMGMSNDYELAVACGSTLVRLGSLLFGERI